MSYSTRSKNYAMLGTSCSPMTMACTSNHKYLSMLNPDYRKIYTDMYLYPGSSINFLRLGIDDKRGEFSDDLSPRSIKSFFGKGVQNHKDTDLIDIKPIPSITEKPCKSCRKY